MLEKKKNSLMRKEMKKREKIALLKKLEKIEERKNYLRIKNRAKSTIHLDRYENILQTQV